MYYTTQQIRGRTRPSAQDSCLSATLSPGTTPSCLHKPKALLERYTRNERRGYLWEGGDWRMGVRVGDFIFP